MDAGRRRALALIGAGGAAAVGLPIMQAAAAQDTFYLSANARTAGGFALAGFAPDGARRFEIPLPGRGHGVAVGGTRGHAVAFARRPGVFAIAIDLRHGTVVKRFAAPAGLHFYGHGVFSRDGRRLYTTENDYEAGAGVVGVWDAVRGYRRLGQFPSRGVGPHEIRLSPDGAQLIVANGGIRTHPGAGREKLNIATMDPSLAYLDRRSGILRRAVRFAAPRHRKLSLRHIAVSRSGVVCAALQDQIRQNDAPPLLALHRPGADRFVFGDAPQRVARRMRGYTGSVALDSEGRIAAVSAPRGNLVCFWNIRSGRYLAHCDIADCSGVAAAGRPGRFLLTSGVGGALEFDVRHGRATPLPADFVGRRRWDNHLVAAG